MSNIYSVLIRTSDNLLQDLLMGDRSQTEDEKLVRISSIQYPGTWEYTEINVQQYVDAQSALTLNKASFLENDTVVPIQDAPQLSYELVNGDIIITITAEDQPHTVYWECISPDMVSNTATDTLVNGENILEIEAGQEGYYDIVAIIPEQGIARLRVQI